MVVDAIGRDPRRQPRHRRRPSPMMVNEPVFDWVTARAGCTGAVLFDILVETVQRDVQVIQTLARNTDGDRRIFSVEAQKGRCVVRRTPGRDEPVDGCVAFTLTPRGAIDVERIRASDHGRTPMFTAVARLQDDGRCGLVIGKQPVHVWQLAKRALEGLFFDCGEHDA